MMRNLLLLCVVAATLALGSSAAHAISATLSFAHGDRPDAGMAAEVDAAELDETVLAADETVLAADETVLAADETVLAADETVLAADETLLASFIELSFVAAADTLISNADGTLEGRPAFRIHGPGSILPFAFRGPHGDAIFERRGIWSLLIRDLARASVSGEAISALIVTGNPSNRGGRTVTVPVPEPTTASMFLLGLLGLARRPV